MRERGGGNLSSLRILLRLFVLSFKVVWIGI